MRAVKFFAFAIFVLCCLLLSCFGWVSNTQAQFTDITLVVPHSFRGHIRIQGAENGRLSGGSHQIKVPNDGRVFLKGRSPFTAPAFTSVAVYDDGKPIREWLPGLVDDGGVWLFSLGQDNHGVRRFFLGKSKEFKAPLNW